MARLYSDPMQNLALRSALAAAGQNGSISTPPQQDFNTPAMEGSMQQLLADNLGQYVVVEFLIGTQTTVQKGGILYAVGTSVITLYQELTQTFITCDIFSIKFVTFYLPGHRPWQVNFPSAGPVPGQWSTPGQWGAPVDGQTGMTGPGVDMSFGMGGGMPQGQSAPGAVPPIDMGGWTPQAGQGSGQAPANWG